jgi:hypothetical protein
MAFINTNTKSPYANMASTALQQRNRKAGMESGSAQTGTGLYLPAQKPTARVQSRKPPALMSQQQAQQSMAYNMDDDIGKKYKDIAAERQKQYGLEMQNTAYNNALNERKMYSQLGANSGTFGGNLYSEGIGQVNAQGLANNLNTAGRYQTDLQNLMLDEIQRRKEINLGQADIQSILAGLGAQYGV